MISERIFAKQALNVLLQTGFKLLKDSLEDELSAVMLISLSKIASKWTILISAQIELLTLFLTQEQSLDFQVTTLRCLNFTLAKGVFDHQSTTVIVHKLLSIMNKSEFSQQFKALEILCKILLYGSSTIPCMEMLEIFQGLFTVVQNMIWSSSKSMRILVFRVLADVSGKILGRADMASSEIGHTLASKVISFLLDRISVLVRIEIDCHQPELEMELEVKSSLNLLVNLVENQSYLCCLVLNRIHTFIDNLIEELGRSDSPSDDILEFNSKLMFYLFKVVVVCIQNLDVTDAETSQVFSRLKHQIDYVRQCSFFNNYIRTIYCLLSHFCSCICSGKQDMRSLDETFSLSRVHSIIQLDILTLDCTKKLLEGSNYWSSYKAGKLAACQGAWSTAALVFEHIHTMVQSTPGSNWLKSLSQFSDSEKKIRSFFITYQDAFNLNHSTVGEDGVVSSEPNGGKRKSFFWKINKCNNIENLISACRALSSAEKTLGDPSLGLLFSFQRWFLSLRAKLLASVVDIMKLLNTISIVQCSNSPAEQWERTDPVSGLRSLQGLSSFVESFTGVSLRMNKLTLEFDLFVTSFIGMDRESVNIVSELALRCSLMAFGAGFVFLIPNLQSSENYKVLNSEYLREPVHALLLEDLVGRLRQIDTATRTSLLFLMKSIGKSKGSFPPRFRNQISDSYETRVMLKLCDYAIMKIVALQNAGEIQGGEDMSRTLYDGSQLLLNIISLCILIPFRTPKHFFRVRPHITSELFLMNEDGKHGDGISVSSGCSLSLSLCLQLRNIPAGTPFRHTKFFCILSCQTSSPPSTTEMGETEAEINDLVGLNEQLASYVIGSTKSCRMKCRGDTGDWIVNQYVKFELNEKGQGFSSCLIDVSSFPMGSYRIKWLSCCVDSGGSYWSLLPLNAGPVFTIRDSKNFR